MFCGNNGVYKYDEFGLFGDGYKKVCVEWKNVIVVTGSRFPLQMKECVREIIVEDPDYKGHYQFPNAEICKFDYTAEDHGFWTSPFNIITGLYRHFKPRDEELVSQIEQAITSCDANAFQSYAHQLQDFYSHYDKGYRWWTLGHAFAGTKPDKDNGAWKEAETDTQKFLDKWEKNCCLACPISDCKWIPRSKGMCSKELEMK